MIILNKGKCLNMHKFCIFNRFSAVSVRSLCVAFCGERPLTRNRSQKLCFFVLFAGEKLRRGNVKNALAAAIIFPVQAHARS